MSTSESHRRRGGTLRVSLLALGAALAFLPAPAAAQTLESALSRAYGSNPTLNAQRAQVRATDEQVPQALSGYRPIITATGDVGAQRTRTVADSQLGQLAAVIPGLPPGALPQGRTTQIETNYPRGAGVAVQQNVFNGFQTRNQVRTAESNILGARETLRNSEQNVLFDAAQAYMDVLRDYAILDVRRNNVQVLEEELRAARERFQVGEVTRTDTAQAESSLQGARSQVSAAESQLNTSRATYRQVVGEDISRPRAARSIDKLLPRSLPQAIGLSQAQHPAILAAFHGVDAATLQIRVFEGQLLPSLNLEASFQRRYDESSADRLTSGAVVGRLTIPIYEGGSVYSQVRQAKETAGQRRLEADIARDQVRQATVSAWGQVEGATAQIAAAQAQIEASQTALNGVREEAKVGQRTTLDVLNAQQDLLNARQSLITAQRDRVVAAYALLSAVGWLTADKLGLKVVRYDPNTHYDQVRDKWIGLRTPDGR
ncbi:TolC family outer membrane protein [Methylopila turkensis]|uniref:Channel protein TolC n=1 Tax=Methylopila turkensis TaxID=1437816 RepID=A0A9W6N7W3_9HYPH|nr:TolC family outer membrane protein [Methylopila turkensis]GLK80832.1 channel protein TolC [Methylopila turkensis]